MTKPDKLDPYSALLAINVINADKYVTTTISHPPLTTHSLTLTRTPSLALSYARTLL